MHVGLLELMKTRLHDVTFVATSVLKHKSISDIKSDVIKPIVAEETYSDWIVSYLCGQF